MRIPTKNKNSLFIFQSHSGRICRIICCYNGDCWCQNDHGCKSYIICLGTELHGAIVSPHILILVSDPIYTSPNNCALWRSELLYCVENPKATTSENFAWILHLLQRKKQDVIRMHGYNFLWLTVWPRMLF